MKYKILYINLFPEIGGAETSLIYLLKALDKNKFEPFVIVPGPGQFSQRLENLCRVIYLPLPGYVWRMFFIPGMNLTALYKFVLLCRNLKPDLIHLNHITLSFYTGITNRLLHIPVLTQSWMNSDCVYFYQNLFNNFGSHLILPVSDEVKVTLMNKGFLPENKIRVVVPGIDCAFYRPILLKSNAKLKIGLNPRKLTISMVSRFDPVKDHLTFLKAMNLVIKNFPDVQITIAQDPQTNLDKVNNSAPQIKQQIDDYLYEQPNLKARIIFTGYIADIRRILDATDILVNSSIYESLGISLIEAAASGIPVVTTHGIKHNAVLNNHTGFLLPIGNPKVMAEKILHLLKNPVLRKKFGLAARQHVLKNFNLLNYTRKIEEIYLELINK